MPYEVANPHIFSICRASCRLCGFSMESACLESFLEAIWSDLIQ
jgi:hypothetical protein